MSLTRHISAKTEPLHSWLVGNLPETRSVSTATNRWFRQTGGETVLGRDGAVTSIRFPEVAGPIDLEGADNALIGTAMGYLISAALPSAEAASEPVAAIGAELVAEEGWSIAKELQARASRRLAELAVDGLDQRIEESAACAIVLARFEQHFRAGNPVRQHVVGPLVDWDVTDVSSLSPLLASSRFADAPTRAGLEILARDILGAPWPFAPEQGVVLGPVFEQSPGLGGADGDLIVGSTLIDMKASATTRIAGRPELWQLAGYLLSDTTDRYGLTDVGIWALRRGKLRTWGALEYLRLLGGDPTLSLDAWRQEFALVVADLPVKAVRVPGPPTGRGVGRGVGAASSAPGRIARFCSRLLRRERS